MGLVERLRKDTRFERMCAAAPRITYDLLQRKGREHAERELAILRKSVEGDEQARSCWLATNSEFAKNVSRTIEDEQGRPPGSLGDRAVDLILTALASFTGMSVSEWREHLLKVLIEGLRPRKEDEESKEESKGTF